MRYRNLGRSGLQVSSVAFGSWLVDGDRAQQDTFIECIHHASGLGIVFFDSADIYGAGESEELLGRALAQLPRDSYVVGTKVYFPTGPGPNERGLSRKHMTEQLHQSLRRLRLDYVDLYQCHRHDGNTPTEETCRAMNEFVQAGKVLYWGVSEWTSDQLVEAVELCRGAGWVPPVSNQVQYSAIWRRVESDLLQTCRDLGVGVVAWSPLAMGMLTGKYTAGQQVPMDSRMSSREGAAEMGRYFNEDVLVAVEALKPIASDAGVTLAQLALAWVIRRESVASAVFGARSLRQVEENAAAADLSLGEGVFEQMDSVLEPVVYREETDPWLRA